MAVVGGGTAPLGSGMIDTYSPSPWLSKLLLSWVSPLMGQGFKRTLEVDDLAALPPHLRLEQCEARLRSAWSHGRSQGRNWQGERERGGR